MVLAVIVGGRPVAGEGSSGALCKAPAQQSLWRQTSLGQCVLPVVSSFLGPPPGTSQYTAPQALVYARPLQSPVRWALTSLACQTMALRPRIRREQSLYLGPQEEAFLGTLEAPWGFT